MAKEIKFNTEVRSKMKDGADALANAVKVRLDLLEQEQGPGLGVAMLSAFGRGAYPSLEKAAEQCVRMTGCIEPDAELTARYEERYQMFRKIYPALKALFQEMK